MQSVRTWKKKTIIQTSGMLCIINISRSYFICLGSDISVRFCFLFGCFFWFAENCMTVFLVSVPVSKACFISLTPSIYHFLGKFLLLLLILLRNEPTMCNSLSLCSMSISLQNTLKLFSKSFLSLSITCSRQSMCSNTHYWTNAKH